MIFSIEKVDYKKVIVKVDAKDPLTIAEHPYLQSDYAYITVTKGKNHTLTVIKDNGKTFSFSWGIDGYTLISDNLESLRTHIVAFIESQGFSLNYIGQFLGDARIFYNSNYKMWQLVIDGTTPNADSICFWSKTANTLAEMIDWCKTYVTASDWKERIAVTGIKVWDAVDPVFTIK